MQKTTARQCNLHIEPNYEGGTNTQQAILIKAGYNVVKPQGAMANAGQTVKRRYTDIWMKDKKSWKLTARQATIVSIN